MQSSLKDTFYKTVSMVDTTTRRRAFFMLLIILLGVVFESVGIGLLFPFIKLLINPDEIEAYRQYIAYLPLPKHGDVNTMLIAMSVLVLVLFLFKNAMLILIYFIQARFTVENMRLLSSRLYYFYLRGSYALHLSRNSADLIQNIHAATSSALVGSFMGFLTLLSEILLMIAVVALLLAIDPVITVTASVILGFGVGILYFLLHERVRYWGERTLIVQKEILKSLQQGLHSIKEIKVLGREKFVLNAYAKPLDEYVWLITIKQVMVQAPRLWIETITICTIMAVIIYALLAGQSASSILPVLTVFAAAALRMIPSMNRVMVALNRINDAKHSVDVIYEDLALLESEDENTKPEITDAAVAFSHDISLRNVTYNYDISERAAVNNVTLQLAKGMSLGIVGPSGSGKSTMADLLLGLLTPTEGKVLVDGVDITGNRRAWQRRLGYVPQSIYLLDDTLRRNIALGIPDEDIDPERIERAIHLAQINEFIKTLSHGLDTTVNEHGVRLSGGQRQRVGIARALYHDPDVIVFDEATSALDSNTEQEVNRAIESLSGEKTLIIIAHRLSTVRKCDQLVLLRDGSIEASGSFEKLSASSDAFRTLVAHSQV